MTAPVCRRRRRRRRRLSPLPLTPSLMRAALTAALAASAAFSSLPLSKHRAHPPLFLLVPRAADAAPSPGGGGGERRRRKKNEDKNKKKKYPPRSPDGEDGGWVARNGHGWKIIKGGKKRREAAAAAAAALAAPPSSGGDVVDSAGARGIGFPQSVLLLPPWDQIPAAHGSGKSGGELAEWHLPALDLADRIMKRMFLRRDDDDNGNGEPSAGKNFDSPFAKRAQSRSEKQQPNQKRKGRNDDEAGCNLDGPGSGGGGRGRKRRALRRWWRRRRYDADSHTAYGMAVLSSLAYWEFHRKALPEGSRSGFSVYGSSDTIRLGKKSGGAGASVGGGFGGVVGDAAAKAGRNLRSLAEDVRGVLRRAGREAEMVADRYLAPHLATFTSAKISPLAKGQQGGKDDKGGIPRIGAPSRPESISEESNPEEFPSDEKGEGEERDTSSSGFTDAGDDYTLEYYFYNWHEPGKFAGGAVRWHDTDLLVSSSGGGGGNGNNGHGDKKRRRDNVVLTFAGTHSPSDHATNAQTFEPASHSGLFGRGIAGSLHRGFLNAYARVDSGSVLRVNGDGGRGARGRGRADSDDGRGGERGRPRASSSSSSSSGSYDVLRGLHGRFGGCTPRPTERQQKQRTKARKKEERKREKKEKKERERMLRDQKKKRPDDADEDAVDNGDGGGDRAGNGNEDDDATEMATDTSLVAYLGPPQHASSSSHESNSNSTTGGGGGGAAATGPGCPSRGERLVDIVREVATDVLRAGGTLHLSGHSLGGALATLAGLDLVVNLPRDVPVHRVHVWTFGAPEVADGAFFEAASWAYPRLRRLVHRRWVSSPDGGVPAGGPPLGGGMAGGGGGNNFRRYVTLSDGCKADAVSGVASALTKGKTARRIGGIRRGGSPAHPVGPRYLPPPPKLPPPAPPKPAATLRRPSRSEEDEGRKVKAEAEGAGGAGGASASDSGGGRSAAGNALSAHIVSNYLGGISRESSDHPLRSDFPPSLAKWLGENAAVDPPPLVGRG